MIHCVLWDIDGTLLNFIEAEKFALKSTFQHFQLGECSEAITSLYHGINDRYWKKLERGEITKPRLKVERFDDLFSLLHLQTDTTAFARYYESQLGETVLFEPGAKEILLFLKEKGILQYAVTNGNKVTQDKKLAKSHLNEILNGVFISELVGYEKPSVPFFDAILKEIPIPKEEILIVGDSLTSDIQGGRNAGIETVWYNPDHLPSDDKPIDHVIASLEELKAILI